jgi:hypothetical protein
MPRSAQMLLGSTLAGLVVAVFWLGAPLLPALVGGGGAAAVLYWRHRHDAGRTRGDPP